MPASAAAAPASEPAAAPGASAGASPALRGLLTVNAAGGVADEAAAQPSTVPAALAAALAVRPPDTPADSEAGAASAHGPHELLLAANVATEGAPVRFDTDGTPARAATTGLRLAYTAPRHDADGDAEVGLDPQATPSRADGSDDAPLEIAPADVARAASVTFTAGLLWWLTRGGGLLAIMLMNLPAWRHVDLLPVLARHDDEPDTDDNDERDGHDVGDAHADAHVDPFDAGFDDPFHAGPAPAAAWRPAP